MAENNITDEMLAVRMTKSELMRLSAYFIDKDNDIEGYGIDEVVTNIHQLANTIEISIQENEA